MMRKKIVGFVRVRAYIYQSFFLSMILCPPAAGYIAYKKPDIGVAQRIVLGTIGVLTAPVLTAVVVYIGGRLVRFYALQRSRPHVRGH